MGSWGTGIFSNDIAADLRDDFRDLVANGYAAEAATEKLQSDYGIGSGAEDDNDFWLGLASTQHRVGHVVPGVIDRALQIIDDSAELDRWDPEHRARRLAALEKLRAQLSGPPSAPRRLRVRKTVATALAAGQHVVFEISSIGPVLLRIVGVQEDKGGQHPRAIAVRWDGRERSLKRADRLPPMDDPDRARHSPGSARAIEGEALGFVLLGGDPPSLRVLPKHVSARTPIPKWTSAWVTPWDELDRWFVDSSTPKQPYEATEQ